MLFGPVTTCDTVADSLDIDWRYVELSPRTRHPFRAHQVSEADAYSFSSLRNYGYAQPMTIGPDME